MNGPFPGRAIRVGGGLIPADGLPVYAGNLENRLVVQVLEPVITSYSIHYTKLYEAILGN